MSTDDDRLAHGPGSFVHLDVKSSFARLASPNSPLEYVTTLTRQFPLNDRTPVNEPKPAIALADYGLQSAVTMAMACAQAGVEHLCGLRLRVVPEASWHPWAEQPSEVLLLAGDEDAWLSLIALHNRGHLSGADFRGPRVDLQDLEELCRGELICLTGPPLVGVLAPALERCADPSNPVDAFPLTRHLRELFPDRLYLEIAYHGHPREKVVNRALMALSNRFDLPLVATNAVQYARRQDAQAAAVLEAMRANRRTHDASGPTEANGADRELPIVGSDSTVVKAQAYLRTPAEMHRLFAQVPHALSATVEIRDRLRFRLPLAADQPPEERYGPALLFGLGPALDSDCQRLADVVSRALGERFEADGRGRPTAEVTARATREVDDLCRGGLAELVLTAYAVAPQDVRDRRSCRCLLVRHVGRLVFPLSLGPGTSPACATVSSRFSRGDNDARAHPTARAAHPGRRGLPSRSARCSRLRHCCARGCQRTRPRRPRRRPRRDAGRPGPHGYARACPRFPGPLPVCRTAVARYRRFGWHALGPLRL